MRVSALKNAIDACNFCAQSCDTLAAMSLHMPADSIALCFQTAVDCAFVCRAAADSMSCQAPSWSKACQFAVRMCRLTARECRKHSAIHFQNTAAACETCATECERLAARSAEVTVRPRRVSSPATVSHSKR